MGGRASSNYSHVDVYALTCERVCTAMFGCCVCGSATADVNAGMLLRVTPYGRGAGREGCTRDSPSESERACWRDDEEDCRLRPVCWSCVVGCETFRRWVLFKTLNGANTHTHT